MIGIKTAFGTTITAHPVRVWVDGCLEHATICETGNTQWAHSKRRAEWVRVRPCESDGKHPGDWAHDTRS